MARTADHAHDLSWSEAAPAPGTAQAGGFLARAWAQHLLSTLGLNTASLASFGIDQPAVLNWASSGLMALTGEAHDEPQICPLPLAACADGALAALAVLAPSGAMAGLRGSQMLAERAALTAHLRQGAVSPGGSCRLLQVADGEIALNLARDMDWDLLPAWLEQDCDRTWESLAARVQTRRLDSLVERGRTLGLALAQSPQDFRRAEVSIRKAEITSELRALRAPAHGPRPAPVRSSGRNGPPLVVDLSSLWAGPLCSHLLQLCGADVIKLESLRRPDGARAGSPAFFDLLNGGKRSVALDFQTTRGREQLRALLLHADIVIEASRPRALRQLGIDAEAIVRERGSTWISLSGYGRGEAQEHWIAYGDDAGVAAGLSRVMREVTGRSLFVGDAIADPLTGIHAALLAWASWCRGGTRLVPLSLAGVTRECIEFDLPQTATELRRRHQDWTAIWRHHGARVATPSAREPKGRAPSLGEHSDAVLGAMGIAC